MAYPFGGRGGDAASRNEETRTQFKQTSQFRSAAPPVQQSLTELNKAVVRMASNIPDSMQAEQAVRELVSDGYRSLHASEIQALEVHRDDRVREEVPLRAAIEELRQREIETPEWIPAAEANQKSIDETRQEVHVSAWQFRHKVEAAALGLGAIPALIIGSMLTAHGNLVASGMPVFVDNPVLPWAMAVTPAVGAVAMKTIGSIFETEPAKRRFRHCLYTGAVAFTAFWSVAFADQFHGFSGSLDIFGEAPDWKTTAFTSLQLGTEILVGAALWLRLDQIASRYSPDHYFHNSKRLALTEARESSERLLAGLVNDLAHIEGQLAEHQATLRLQTEMAVLAMRERRSRFES